MAYLKKKCSEISGGELQRGAIVRALVSDKKILLADEPVSAMDPANAKNTLVELVKDSTLIASLHNVELALDFFPRVIGLKKGRIIFDLDSSSVTKEMLKDLYN